MNNKHLSWNKEINNNSIIASRAYFLQNPFPIRVLPIPCSTCTRHGYTPLSPWLNKMIFSLPSPCRGHTPLSPDGRHWWSRELEGWSLPWFGLSFFPFSFFCGWFICIFIVKIEDLQDWVQLSLSLYLFSFNVKTRVGLRNHGNQMRYIPLQVLLEHSRFSHVV